MKLPAIPALLAGAALALCASLSPAADIDRSGGPYVPTPQAVVEAMLKLARVGPRDFVMDLGSGDGRIVLTAGALHKARGVGVEIDPELVDRANATAQKMGIAERVRFVRQDVREADLSRATVLTLYLLPGMMHNLRTKLIAELRPGARVVSHDFTFEQWKPDQSITVETPEKYDVGGSFTSDVHMWIVPARAEGAWRGSLSGASKEKIELDIKQNFQFVNGRLVRGGRSLAVKGRLRGARLTFTAPAEDGRPEQYSATVEGGRLNGEIRDGETVVARWTAQRLP